tara:strand:- start:6 stop:233 length:228 start_codon:yes stop_codon:yes gene_type:complete
MSLFTKVEIEIIKIIKDVAKILNMIEKFSNAKINRKKQINIFIKLDLSPMINEIKTKKIKQNNINLFFSDMRFIR